MISYPTLSPAPTLAYQLHMPRTYPFRHSSICDPVSKLIDPIHISATLLIDPVLKLYGFGLLLLCRLFINTYSEQYLRHEIAEEEEGRKYHEYATQNKDFHTTSFSTLYDDIEAASADLLTWDRIQMAHDFVKREDS
jgi:hypothetical protein